MFKEAESRSDKIESTSNNTLQINTLLSSHLYIKYVKLNNIYILEFNILPNFKKKTYFSSRLKNWHKNKNADLCSYIHFSRLHVVVVVLLIYKTLCDFFIAFLS